MQLRYFSWLPVRNKEVFEVSIRWQVLSKALAKPHSLSQEHPQSIRTWFAGKRELVGSAGDFPAKEWQGWSLQSLPAAVGDIHQAPWQGKLTSFTQRELMKAGFSTTFSKNLIISVLEPSKKAVLVKWHKRPLY